MVEKKVPIWNATGSEPPQSLKNSGFAAGYKPPASYFNWFWHGVSECLIELQNIADSMNVKSYKSYNEIGLTNNDFLSADFKGNIGKIADALQGQSFTMQLYLTYSETRALYNSVQAKIQTDLGITSTTVNNYQVFIRGDLSASTETGTILIDVSDEVGSTIGRVFSCVFIRGLVGDYISSFTCSQHPSGFIPADGSVSMSGVNFYTNNKKGRVYTGNNNLSIHHLKNGAESQDVDTRFIEMYSDSIALEQAFKVGQHSSGTLKRYNIFGEHNKPYGSYTGNGSATTRTIDIGGIGELLCIRGNGATALVTDSGAVLFTQSGTTITKLVGSEIKFENGILTIATNNTGLNKSGLVYNYRLL